MNADSYAEAMYPKMKTWRRELHQFPETGWTEYVTTYRIYEILKELDFTLFTGKDAIHSSSRMGVPTQEELGEAVKRAKEAGADEAFLSKLEGGHTGVVAVLDTGKAGPHTALRFDIDALPIHEAEEAVHFPAEKGFSSSRKGAMHACAHDGHTAIGLATASFLSRHRQELKGKFTLLFQPAEEGSRGAKSMVDKGWLDDVDYFLGGHIGIEDLQIGQIAATADQFLATTKFDVRFHGKASHAGKRPEEGKNALLAAASCVQSLFAISPHSGGATRLNIGTLTAGSGRNIVPDHAIFTGETRGETNELNEYVFSEAKRIIHSSADLWQVEAELIEAGHGTAARCDDIFPELVSRAAKQSSFLTEVLPVIALGASEDVTHMINRVQEKGGKATYMIFGTPLKEGHHHPRFDFNEEVLKTGLLAFLTVLIYMQTNEKEWSE
ncbi:amidohydrolase [Jeotgalibacillus proteolyticus]|uniref:Peptidase M20 n=1 Tax=Jeotgalibacillus proteolyticus TaxID=2082395 RepID=A0A2S5GBD4_9BACL|nr:amidohydrolase [Jeotgalibacillus proteolyticus]PPA70310.1 peptidase M20 [Jeotgalibacillus proteolyticus]